MTLPLGPMTTPESSSPTAEAAITAKPPVRITLSQTRDGFERFGLLICHDGAAGDRTDFSQVFETLDTGAVPRLHVNRIEPSVLPLTLTSLERHPAAWQTFLPLDVSRYLACVAVPLADGRPDPTTLQAWILDGRTGVAFAPGIWHAGATVFDAPGRFAVIWPRRDAAGDTEIFTLPQPMRIEE
jgi:ureidoglycolate lyase